MRKNIKGFFEYIKEEIYNDVISIGNGIYMSSNLDELPKEDLILKHFYHSDNKIKIGDIGIFAVPISYQGIEDSFGDSVVYISVSKNSKIRTIDSTEDFLYKKGLFSKNNKYLKDKYSNIDLFKPQYVKNGVPEINSYEDLSNNFYKLKDQNYDGNIYYYEIQKEVVKLIKEENGNFDILEMLREDDIIKHQYLILK
jgi:hypothetical protein